MSFLIYIINQFFKIKVLKVLQINIIIKLQFIIIKYNFINDNLIIINKNCISNYLSYYSLLIKNIINKYS